MSHLPHRVDSTTYGAGREEKAPFPLRRARRQVSNLAVGGSANINTLKRREK
jgi:hypothetical protein